MPDTNIVSVSAFDGASDTIRHNLPPARRETDHERIIRHFNYTQLCSDMVNEWKVAKAAVTIVYRNRTEGIR